MSSTPMEVTESLEKNVRAVLMSFPKGVLLAKFCGHYRGTAKETFPWRALGISVPAAVRVRGVPSVSLCQVTGVQWTC